MSIAIQWFENPAFDAPELKSPQPCIHGAGCVYTKKTADGKVIPAVCGFVHPGEEGKGRRLFPARTIIFEHPDGDDVVEQPACVRLIGNALYYERMRMRMPWQAFCAVRGIPFTANKPGVYREPVKRVHIGSSVSAAAPRVVKEAVKPVSAVPTVDQGWPVLGGGPAEAVPLPIPHAIVEAEVIAISAARVPQPQKKGNEVPLCYKCEKARAWSGVCIDCYMADHSKPWMDAQGRWRFPDTHNIRQGYYMSEEAYAHSASRGAAAKCASAGVWQSCGSDYEDDYKDNYEDDCDVCGKPVEYCPEHGDHGDERRDWARAKCE